MSRNFMRTDRGRWNWRQRTRSARWQGRLGAALSAALSLFSWEASIASVFLDVVVEDRFFAVATSRPTIRVRTRGPARVDVLLYNRDDRLVAVRSSPDVSTRHVIPLADLPRVARGMLYYAVIASQPDGAVLDAHPTDPGGGQLLHLRDAVRDPEEQTVSFLVPQAGFVRLRAGIEDGPCLATIVPWTPRPAGPCTIPWDGTCQGGLFRNLYDHPALQVTAVSIAAPNNLILEETNWADPEGAPPSVIHLPRHLERYRRPTWADSPSRTRGELGRLEDDYRLDLKITGDAANETAAVRVDCHPHDRARLLRQRFEIMLFLDTVFLMEEEQGILPFTYPLSMDALAPGRHLVTVNIVDVTGRLGVVTAPLLVEPL